MQRQIPPSSRAHKLGPRLVKLPFKIIGEHKLRREHKLSARKTEATGGVAVDNIAAMDSTAVENARAAIKRKLLSVARASAS